MAKISIAGIKKQGLWIGGGLAIVIGAACWYVATGRLATAYRANKAHVETKFKAIDERIKNPENRSEKSIEGIRRDIIDAHHRVKRTWEDIYREQAEKVFIWPEGLTKTFRDTIARLPPDGDLPERLREEYQNFVRGEFRRQLAVVDATVGEDTSVAGLRWKDAERIEGTFGSRQTPSSTWIRLRQEDLWVYNAFCKVIAAVNKGVTGRTALPIKIIDTLEIGDVASRSAPAQIGQKRLKRIKSGSSDSSSAAAVAAAASGTADEALKDRRYVDAKWKPMMASELATNSPLEFKLIPFRMVLFMDQRDIDRLLLEFRRSVLPIEVLEMRINASGGTSSAFSDGRDPGSSAHHVPVELRGVVYIYNPPHMKKLDFVKETETAVAAAGRPAAEVPHADTPLGETPSTETTTTETPETAPPTSDVPTPEVPAAPDETPAVMQAAGKLVSLADGKLKVKAADDSEQDLDMADNVQVTIDGAPATIEGLKPDMVLEISKQDDKVTIIHAKSAE
jgi:hypothetical protein